jgi:hypothetical protein
MKDDFSNDCTRFKKKVTSKMANAEVTSNMAIAEVTSKMANAEALNVAAKSPGGKLVRVNECNNNNNNNNNLHGQNNGPRAFYTT